MVLNCDNYFSRTDPIHFRTRTAISIEMKAIDDQHFTATLSDHEFGQFTNWKWNIQFEMISFGFSLANQKRTNNSIEKFANS